MINHFENQKLTVDDSYDFDEYEVQESETKPIVFMVAHSSLTFKPTKNPSICFISAIAVSSVTGEVLDSFMVRVKVAQYDPKHFEKLGFNPEDWHDALEPVEAYTKFTQWLSKYTWYEYANAKDWQEPVCIPGGHNYNAYTQPMLDNWVKALTNTHSSRFSLPTAIRPTVDTINVVEGWQALTGNFGPSSIAAQLEVIGSDVNPNNKEGYEVLAALDIWRYYREQLNAIPNHDF